MVTTKTRSKKIFSFFKLGFSLYKIEHHIDINKEIRFLDVGCGSKAPINTTNRFPNAEYHGIDIVDRNDTPEVQKCMKKFYKKDLKDANFEDIPDDFFDVISMVHVIEHIPNGEAVIEALIPKLKKGGIMYIEFPGIKSTELPKMNSGTLNFYDDDTHIRIYSLKEIYNALSLNGMRFISGGKRKRLLHILIIPFSPFYLLYKSGSVDPSVFWDLLGFAEYCVFEKK